MTSLLTVLHINLHFFCIANYGNNVDNKDGGNI